MTDHDLDQIEARAKAWCALVMPRDVIALVAEIRRLRAAVGTLLPAAKDAAEGMEESWPNRRPMTINLREAIDAALAALDGTPPAQD